MARKYSKSASKKVEKVMHERKKGTLKSGSGRKVKSRKQAIAIALHEAGGEKFEIDAGHIGERLGNLVTMQFCPMGGVGKRGGADAVLATELAIGELAEGELAGATA